MKISRAGAVGSFANLDRCLADGELDCQNERELDIGATGKMSTIGGALRRVYSRMNRELNAKHPSFYRVLPRLSHEKTA